MLRKSHILFFIVVFGLVALGLTNGFANDDDVLLGATFEAPTAERAEGIRDNAEYQIVPDNIIGSNDLEKMRDLDPNSVDYQLGTKVGWFLVPHRTRPGRYWSCTGFLVGPDLFLTNHHCLHDDFGILSVTDALVFMDYYQDVDVDPRRGGVTAGVVGVLRMDELKDYALLRLDTPIGDDYGWLELDADTPVDSSQSVKLISHPQFRSKEIVRNNTQIVDIPPGLIAEYPELNYGIAYLADSEGGSSGSPVFLRDGTGVIGIHHSAWTFRGDPLFNAGTLMSYIVPEIQHFLPSDQPTLPPTQPPTQMASRMYWTDTGTGQIHRANLDGSGAENPVRGMVSPTDIAVDLTGGKMYWTDEGSGQIHRANLDGSNVEILIRRLASPTGIALDTADNKIYWTDTRMGAIQRANLDGSGTEHFIRRLVSPTGIALDTAGNKVYWTDEGSGQIQRANLDGSNVEILIRRLVSPTDIALDLTDGKMYWTDTGTGQIHRANLDGSNIETLVRRLVSPTGIALDTAGNKVYWTDTRVGAIQRANLDGSDTENLVRRLVSPRGIDLGVSGTGGTLRFNPSSIPDQTFTVGQEVNLQLPAPTGGTPPYFYSLTPTLPTGLYFVPVGGAYGLIGGTPTAAAPPLLYTYTATDSSGASGALTFTIRVTVDASTRVDVNGDGVVNNSDLVIVALFYGARVLPGTDFAPDVNLDLVVDLLDLTLVAQAIDAAGGGTNTLADLQAALAAAAAALEDVAAAPNVLSDGIAYRNVAAALADARKLDKDVPEAVLEELLHFLAEMGAIPEKTALLPNYPNPFNPETWLPYQLATPAEVTLSIYSVDGQLVRMLNLGHQPAGIYESRSRAAYWDGKNQHGEPVASGVYFYTLTAGEFTATRKMLIAK